MRIVDVDSFCSEVQRNACLVMCNGVGFTVATETEIRCGELLAPLAITVTTAFGEPLAALIRRIAFPVPDPGERKILDVLADAVQLTPVAPLNVSATSWGDVRTSLRLVAPQWMEVRLKEIVTAKAGCETVNFRPATVSVPDRGLAAEFAATLNATVPDPVPLEPLVIVTHGTLLVDDQPQPFVVLTFTLPVAAPEPKPTPALFR